jgi:CRP-like cAMP-binding protein
MLNARAESPAPRLRLRQAGTDIKVVARPVSLSPEQPQLFADIPGSDCAKIVFAARTADFRARQTIFVAGYPINEIVLLTEGSVKIMQLGEDASAVILRLEGPGGVIGSLGVVERAEHCSMAQAILPCEALIWSVPAFAALSERFPLLKRNMMRIVSQRLHVLEARFREISTKRVAPRLARELVRLLPQIGRRVNNVLEINLSQEELAQMTGTTLYTVSRLLKSWERQGIVSLRPQAVTVQNLLCLLGLSELR